MAQILIVDDSLSTILEKLGHTVSTAENGEAGIAKARAEKPDLILMDVVMPGMNGFQATRQLTKDTETAEIPIIIVTTKDQETEEAILLEKVNSLIGG